MQRFHSSTDQYGLAVHFVRLAADRKFKPLAHSGADRLLNAFGIENRNHPSFGFLFDQFGQQEGAVAGGATADIVASIE